MKRILTLLFLCITCSGCTVMVVPHPRAGQGQSIVYMAVTQNATPKAPVVAPSANAVVGQYLGLASGQQLESAACANMQPPSFTPVPPMTPLTTAQRKNMALVETTLVDYILNLRAYVAGVIDTSNRFYSNYAAACKNVAQPSIK